MKKLETLKRNWKRFALPVLLGTSIVYISIYLVIKFQFTSDVDVFSNSIWTNFYEISLAVLGSGMFLATLKYFQFLDFFVDEIQKVIYTDKYLKGRGDLYEVWQRVTRTLLESELPDPVVNEMVSEISTKFLTKTTLDYYIQSLDARYTLSIDNSGYVTIEEWLHFKIINKDKSSTKFGFDYFLKLLNRDDFTTNIQFESLNINGDIVERADDSLKTKRTEKEVKLSFERMIDGLEESVITQKIVFNQTIKADKEFFYTGKRIIKDISVTIDNRTPDELGIIFTEIGITTFKKSCEIPEIYNSNIVLPNYGFKMFFYQK
jgi:hypothetical protein